MAIQQVAEFRRLDTATGKMLVTTISFVHSNAPRGDGTFDLQRVISRGDGPVAVELFSKTDGARIVRREAAGGPGRDLNSDLASFGLGLRKTPRDGRPDHIGSDEFTFRFQVG